MEFCDRSRRRRAVGCEEDEGEGGGPPTGEGTTPLGSREGDWASGVGATVTNAAQYRGCRL